MTGSDDERRRRLLEAKLRALVRGHLGIAPGPEADAAMAAVPAAGGTAVRVGHALWVYVPGAPARALGRAAALFVRSDATELDLVLDEPSGHDARVAGLLAAPVRVWSVDGTALRPVEALALASPADPPAGPATSALVALLTDAGVDVVVEHGVIVGEVRGLEVARVRVTDDGGVVLDIGVGRFDQEAGALLHGDRPTAAALASAVELVAAHRRGDAAAHPVNRLARERWLRAQLVDDPASVGLGALHPISPPLPRRNVKDPAPAAAIGAGPDDEPVLVVCTVGVDLEWMPVAVDLVERERPARVVVALPARDLLPVQHRLADLVAAPVQFVCVEGDWPA
jgi:hypothetical protein